MNVCILCIEISIKGNKNNEEKQKLWINSVGGLYKLYSKVFSLVW